MSVIEAIILGIIQGLTEFLPVSSSGHIELGKVILGLEGEENLSFTVVVHGATVLSTIVIFRQDIWNLTKGFFQFQWNEETQYVAKIFVSMIPVGIIGLFFKEEVEAFFTGNVLLVGMMLIVTALLLTFTYYSRQHDKNVSYAKAIIIGVAQAIAVIPGISRAGATISSALVMNVKKEAATRFSFLMVLIPIIGANLKDIASGDLAESSAKALPLFVGFIAAFISGLAACKWMIAIVQRGNLIYFAIYCFIVGTIAILYAWLA